MSRLHFLTFFLLVLALVQLGCAPTAQSVESVAGVSATQAPAVPPTAAPQNTVAPQPTVAPTTVGVMKTVKLENISLSYDSRLATDVKGQAVPKLASPFVPFDSYQFDFVGYSIKSPAEPKIWVFAVKLPPEAEAYQKGMDALKQALKDGSSPAKTLPVYLTGPDANKLVLPILAPINARAVISTQWNVIKRSTGNGLRFVTIYSQGPQPLDPNALTYVYSGLNPDGTVAFAAVFPVKLASALKLPAADPKTLLDDLTKLEAYNQQVAEQIAALPESAFVPDMRMLDQIMMSLSVNGPLPKIQGKSATQVMMENCVRDGFGNEANEVDGYCYLYPTRFERKQMADGRFGLVGPALDKSADPLRATFAVEVQPAAGKSLAQLVDAYLKENGAPTLKTERYDMTVGGEIGTVLEPVAGRPTFRAVLVPHNGKLFILRFSPDASFSQAKADVTELFDTIIPSFTFLP